MKRNKLFLSAAVAAILLTSCGKTYEAKDVALKNVNDSVNYAMGVSYGTMLKSEFENDTTGNDQKEFFRAMEKAYKDFASMSSEEIQAYYQGLELGSNIMAQPSFGNDSALKIMPKIAKEAIESVLLGKKQKITSEEAEVVVNRLFTKFTGDSVTVAPTAKELDSLNYAVGVNSATQTKEYFLKNDSNLIATKAYLKGLNVGLNKKSDESRAVAQGENLGVGLTQAAKGAGLLGDSSILANKDLFAQGIVNALAGKDAVFSTIDPQQYIQGVAQKKQEARLEKEYGEYKKAGETFLAENAKRPDVVTTESGLQYQIIKAGKGEKPVEASNVKVHYHGTLIDGTVFDSSVERGEPIVFGVTHVINGWTEALQLMPAGSKWMLYIPQELAYGSQAQRVILPFSALIFEVELIAIEK